MAIMYEGPGDLFNCRLQTIACPINVVGAMGKGLVLQFKDRVPGLFEYYRTHYGNGEDGWQQRVHQLEIFELTPRKKVLLFPTKGHWRESAILSVIEANLSQVADNYEQMGITSLGLPLLGCGHDTGKLSWVRDVRPIVHDILGPTRLHVEVLAG